jgi:hypothetical protein
MLCSFPCNLQVACPAGTYCEANAVNPAPCPAGTYNPASVVSVCQPCPSGAFCPLGSLSPSQCPVGTYNPTPGAANQTVACRPCVALGIYCGIGSTGDVDGKKCPAGSFCPNPSNLTACWKDYYCNEGVTAPTPCPLGTYASAGSSQVSQCSDKGSLCAPG